MLHRLAALAFIGLSSQASPAIALDNSLIRGLVNNPVLCTENLCTTLYTDCVNAQYPPGRDCRELESARLTHLCPPPARTP